jgi:hypothetical protein
MKIPSHLPPEWRAKLYIYGMRYEEWDWPPRRHRFRTRFDDVYQPSGWNSAIAKKAVSIYWRVTIGIIKALLAIVLSVVAIGAFWLLWIIVTL